MGSVGTDLRTVGEEDDDEEAAAGAVQIPRRRNRPDDNFTNMLSAARSMRVGSNIGSVHLNRGDQEKHMRSLLDNDHGPKDDEELNHEALTALERVQVKLTGRDFDAN